MSEDSAPICPLCTRPIPQGLASRHHLVPKLKGGAKGECAILHRICHKKIHKTLSNAEIARSYDTIDKLRAQPEIAGFIKWIAKRPPDFDGRIR